MEGKVTIIDDDRFSLSFAAHIPYDREPCWRHNPSILDRFQ